LPNRFTLFDEGLLLRVFPSAVDGEFGAQNVGPEKKMSEELVINERPCIVPQYWQVLGGA